MSVRSARGRLRRTWPQRLLIVFNVMAIVAALGSAGAIAYGKSTVNEIKRTSGLDRGVIVPVDELEDDSPRNFLVLGLDDAEGLDPDDPVMSRRDEETRGTVRPDVLMIVQINPGTQQARILSLNRDIWVDIPGRSSQRINAAFGYGGGDAALLIETIRENFGIEINHYVAVDLAGFKGIVDQVGGVPMYFPAPVRDPRSQLFVPDAGCAVLDSSNALGLVRSREFQYQDENGRWRFDRTGDHGRVKRQQAFVGRVIQRAISQGARDPFKLANMVEVGADNIELDLHTTPNDLIALGRALRSFDPASLETYSLPVSDARRGGAQVLDVIESQAEPILALFRGTTADDVDEIAVTQITVQVLNGTDVDQQASQTTDRLAEVGFTVRSPGSASAVWQTEIRYRPGAEARALAVARYLDADAALIEDNTVGEVTVVTGPDFVAVLDQPRPAAEVAPTTTTLPETSSTTTTTRADGGKAEEEPELDPLLPGDPPPGVSCG